MRAITRRRSSLVAAANVRGFVLTVLDVAKSCRGIESRTMMSANLRRVTFPTSTRMYWQTRTGTSQTNYSLKTSPSNRIVTIAGTIEPPLLDVLSYSSRT